MKMLHHKTTTFFILLAGLMYLTFLLSSCGSSNHVVSNHLIQKRKYNKGWFVKFPSKMDRNSASDDISSVISTNTGASEKHNVQNQDFTPVNDFKKAAISFHSVETKEVSKDVDQSSVRTSYIQKQIDKMNDAVHSQTEAKKDEQNVTASQGEPEPSPYLEKARRAYNKTWIFTVFSIVSLVGGIILAFNGIIGIHTVIGVCLLIGALVLYVFMFINLTKTVVDLANHNYYRKDNSGDGLNFFAWAHVVIGSAIAILLFWIPLLVVLISVSKERKNLRNK